MSYITLLKGPKARAALAEGMEKVHDAVAASMGPSGRNMYYENRENGYLTKDGATIAKWIHSSRLIDAFQRAGAAIMRHPSMKVEEEAGDGTTATTVLSYAMSMIGKEYVDRGCNVITIENAMKRAGAEAITVFEKLKREAKDPADWEKVAFISTRDAEIAKTIREAMEKVKPDGYIRVDAGDDWREHDLTLEIKEGMTFPRGYAHESAINDGAKLRCFLKDVPILVTDKPLFTEKDAVLLSGIAEACYAQGYKKLVIIGLKFAGRATDFVLQNNLEYHKKGGVNGPGMFILPVEAPGQGTSFTEEFCDDIALLTGARFISDTRGTTLEGVPIDEHVLEALGMCESIESNKTHTTVINSKEGSPAAERATHRSAIDHRVAEITAKYEQAKGELDQRRYKERIAMLTTGMAVITVGGRHTQNIGEKKARVEDGVLATKCAYEAGILPGAGVAYVKAREHIVSMIDGLKDDDERAGFWIVADALLAPMKQIAFNCGIMPLGESNQEVIEAVELLEDTETFSFANGHKKIVDAFVDGVVDPFKVCQSAIVNAIEGAVTFLTTETVGVTVPEDKNGQPIWEVIRGDAARRDEKPTIDPNTLYGGEIVRGPLNWKPKRLGLILRWLW